MNSDSEEKSMVTSVDSPTSLVAYVADDRGPFHFYGYDYFGDLAEYYSFEERVYFALTGKFPTESNTQVLQTLLALLSPCSIRNVSTHVVRISETIKTDPHSQVSLASLAIVEETSDCSRSNNEYPDSGDLENQMLSYARARIDKEYCPALHDESFAPNELVTVLTECLELSVDADLPVLAVLARLPFSIAEGRKLQGKGLFDYPLNVPQFSYQKVKL